MLIEVPRAKAYRESLEIFICSTLIYIILIFLMAYDSVASHKLITGLTTAAILSPFYFMLCYGAYKTFRRTHLEILSPEGERKKRERDIEKEKRSNEFWRYFLGLISLVFSIGWLVQINQDKLSSFDAGVEDIGSMLLFSSLSVGCFFPKKIGIIIKILWIGLLWILGICASGTLLYFSFKALVSLPVSVAVIIGALIIAGAIGRNKN